MKRDYNDLPQSEREALESLADKPDSEIDMKDIPEIHDWSGAQRGVFYRSVKRQITLRLDPDIIAWFKLRDPEGRGYQSLINRALRDYVTEQERASGPASKAE